MPFVKIKGATTNFSKPHTWDEKRDGACGDLWVRVGNYGRYRQHSFAWKPDAEELRLLNEGGAVEIHIISEYMPPVGVTVVRETDK